MNRIKKAALELTVVGPIDIPCETLGKATRKQIKREHAVAFWQNPESKAVEEKQGCYVFAMKAGPGYTPWYVGKTTKGMAKECFQPHKLVTYSEVTTSDQRGKPVMFFVVAPNRRKTLPKHVINDVETFLILAAAGKNPNVMNAKKTTPWAIDGIYPRKRGKMSKAGQAFRNMMGIS